MPGRLALFNFQRYDRATQQALLAAGVASLRPWLSLCLAGLLVLSCAEPAQYSLALQWLGLALAATVAGLAYRGYWRRRLRQPLAAARLRRAELWGIGYSVLVALVWGGSSGFLQPGQESNLLVAMIYFGVCAGAATLSVMGMAHMVAGSLVGFLLFCRPMPLIYPTHGLWFVAMLALYHAVVLMSARQRLDIVVRNVLLAQEQEGLLQSQRQETARANRANQDKSAFLAAASHDLRQPVHALLLLGHALQLKVHDAEARGLVGQMLAAGKSLSDQFNSLMELSRLESGKYTLNLQRQSLADFLWRKQQAFREVAESRRIELRLRIDPRLADAGLYTDLSLLSRVLDNLLDNALKFSPAESVVLLAARLRGGRLQLGVHDRGGGIPLEEQENVFLPHVQLGNPTRDRARGIGLGLSIAREAAQLLRAELTLRSAPGHGCHFRLTLPPDMAPVAIADAPPLAPRALAHPDRLLRGRRLLIVEDDDMAARALRHWAEGRGLDVRHCRDPRSVGSLQDVDLVVCDIRLPGERDGIEWLSAWLDQWPHVGGVLVSGEAGEAVQERADQEGLLLLAKPVDPEMLLQTLLSLTR